MFESAELGHKIDKATYDAIVDACCTAWNSLIATPARLTSITQRKWATAS